MNVIKGNTPNALTCMNLLAGTIAIICGSRGMEPIWGLPGMNWAWIFIGIAAVADFLDGFMARLLGAYSELGKQLDSLCDNVSFGVAPAITLYNALEAQGAMEWLCWFTMVIPICGAVRLARFNIDTRQTTSFIGLPIPANAIFWIGYMAALIANPELLARWWVALPAILIESWLMVSPVKMFSLKMSGLSVKKYWPQMLTGIAGIVFLLSMGVAGLMWLIIFYILLSLVTK